LSQGKWRAKINGEALSSNALEMKLFYVRLKAGLFCDSRCVENVGDNFDSFHECLVQNHAQGDPFEGVAI